MENEILYERKGRIAVITINRPAALNALTPDSARKGILDVCLDRDTLWLNLNQMTALFGRDKSVISRHLRNIFREGELERDSVVAFFATTATDGKTYTVEHFNLDAIISVGYRVNSKRGTPFHIWATPVADGNGVRPDL